MRPGYPFTGGLLALARLPDHIECLPNRVELVWVSPDLREQGFDQWPFGVGDGMRQRAPARQRHLRHAESDDRPPYVGTAGPRGERGADVHAAATRRRWGSSRPSC